MKKLNEVIDCLKRVPGVSECILTLTYREAADIAEAFSALEKRAEAAEKKLENQEPYGWLVGLPGLYPTFTLDYRNVEQAIKAGGYEITPVFTRPAPAVGLAELVPEGWKLVPIEITQEMVDANFEGVCKGGIQSGYRAMLAAAPEPE